MCAHILKETEEKPVCFEFISQYLSPLVLLRPREQLRGVLSCGTTESLLVCARVSPELRPKASDEHSALGDSCGQAVNAGLGEPARLLPAPCPPLWFPPGI